MTAAMARNSVIFASHAYACRRRLKMKIAIGPTNVTTGAALAVFGAVIVLVAICLIVGAAEGKPALLIPWMVYAVHCLIVSTVLYTATAMLFFQMGMGALGAGYMTGTIVHELLETYFILVVYSLYRELKGTAPPTNA